MADHLSPKAKRQLATVLFIIIPWLTGIVYIVRCVQHLLEPYLGDVLSWVASLAFYMLCIALVPPSQQQSQLPSQPGAD